MKLKLIFALMMLQAAPSDFTQKWKKVSDERCTKDLDTVLRRPEFAQNQNMRPVLIDACRAGFAEGVAYMLKQEGAK